MIEQNVSVKHLNHLYLNERLKDHIKAIPDYAITTIVAPMGYGKTTAARWWMKYYQRYRCSNARFYWQDIYGEDLSIFWQSFCHTFRDRPVLEAGLLALGFPQGRHQMGQLVELIRDAVDQDEETLPIFYIMDDLHFLNYPEMGEILLFVAERLPENVHLIVLSRNRVFDKRQQLKCGRLLLEVRADELQLAEDEVLEYAELCGLSLLPEENAALFTMSEGWISMIYLMFRYYIQHGSWQMDTHDIYELIDLVIIDTLSERMHKFLLVCSLAEEFNLDMARALWGEEDTETLMNEMLYANAFVKENRNGFCRYHYSLQQRARLHFDKLPRGEQQTYYTRLGRWYSENQQYMEAAVAFEQAGCWDALLTTILEDRGASMGGVHKDILLRWCTACPEEILMAHPKVIPVLMRKLFTVREIPQMLRMKGLLDRTLESREQNPKLSEAEKKNLQGECLLTMSFLKYNDIMAMSNMHRLAASMMNRPSHCIDATGTWTFGSPSVAMMFHRSSGLLDQENQEMHICMPYYYQLVNNHGYGAEYMMQAETDFLRGNLVDARIHCQTARNNAMEKQQYSIYLVAELLMARMDLFEQNTARMQKRLAELRNLLKENRQYILLNTLDYSEAALRTMAGLPDEAPEWVLSPQAARNVMMPSLPMLQLAIGRILMARGEYTELTARYEKVKPIVEANNYLLCSILMEILMAQALLKLGKSMEAMKHLALAIDQAAADQLKIPFVIERDLKGLLEEYHAELMQEDPAVLMPEDPAVLMPEDPGSGKVKFLEDILALMDVKPEAKDGQSDFDMAMIQSLSPREIQIIRLAAARKTNSEIAQVLCLTENTIKNHLKRIFNKLNIEGEMKNKRLLLEQYLDKLPE